MLHKRLRPEFGHRSYVLASLSMLGGIAALGGLFLEGEGSGGGSSGEGDPGGTGSGGGNQATGASGASGGDPPAKVFATQAEYDAEAAKIRKAAERDAAKKLAEQLGMTVDEAKALIDQRKQDEEAKLSEVEKRERAAEERERKAQEVAAAAEKKARLADVSLALTATDVRSDRVRYATTAVLEHLGDESDEGKITEAVEKVKAEVPEFFRTAPDPKQTPKPPAFNPPGGPKTVANGASSPMERGRERARAAKSNGRDNQSDPFAALGRAVGS